MVEFHGTSEVIASDLVQGWIGPDVTTAVYPCCGSDTRAFTFTHPEFYKTKEELVDLSPKPAPNFFLFIDIERTIQPQSALAFDDDSTKISIERVEELRIGDVPAFLCNALWLSKPGAASCFSSRRLSVLFAVTDWMRYRLLRGERQWIPDLFIGVCDGCAWNVPPEQCVNRLASLGLSRSQQESIGLPRYYITDHFRDCMPFGHLAAGEYVNSSDPNYAYRFRKLALLSGEWGLKSHPGQGLGGATLFKVEPTE